jgi:hypothetical protein
MTELEETVASLQEEVMALRQIVTLLLAQYAANSPTALSGLRSLLDETVKYDAETEMEGVREEMNRIINHAQVYVEAIGASRR